MVFAATRPPILADMDQTLLAVSEGRVTDMLVVDHWVRRAPGSLISEDAGQWRLAIRRLA